MTNCTMMFAKNQNFRLINSENLPQKLLIKYKKWILHVFGIPPKHIKRICGYTTLISPINIQSVAIPDYDKTGTFYRLTATGCAR